MPLVKSLGWWWVGIALVASVLLLLFLQRARQHTVGQQQTGRPARSPRTAHKVAEQPAHENVATNEHDPSGAAQEDLPFEAVDKQQQQQQQQQPHQQKSLAEDVPNVEEPKENETLSSASVGARAHSAALPPPVLHLPIVPSPSAIPQRMRSVLVDVVAVPTLARGGGNSSSNSFSGGGSNSSSSSSSSDSGRIPTFVISTQTPRRVSSLRPLLDNIASVCDTTWVHASLPSDVDKGYGFVPYEGESDGALACLHSHVRVARKIAESEAFAGIALEDDVRPHKDAAARIYSTFTWLRNAHRAHARRLAAGTAEADEEPPHVVCLGFLPHTPSTTPTLLHDPTRVTVAWPTLHDTAYGTMAYLLTREGARRIVHVLNKTNMQAVRAALLERGLRPQLIADWALYEVCPRARVLPPVFLDAVLPSTIDVGRENVHARLTWAAQTRQELRLVDYVGWHAERVLPRILSRGGAIAINCDHRTDRWKTFQHEAQLLGVRFSRLSATYLPDTPALGATRSHMRALTTALESKWEVVAVAEDDLKITDHAALDAAVERIVAAGLHWDVILIVGGQREPPRPTGVPGVVRVVATGCAAFYIVRRAYIPRLLDVYRASEACLLGRTQPYSVCALDAQWNALQRTDTWLMPFPPTASVYAGFSDIDGNTKSDAWNASWLQPHAHLQEATSSSQYPGSQAGATHDAFVTPPPTRAIAATPTSFAVLAGTPGPAVALDHGAPVGTVLSPVVLPPPVAAFQRAPASTPPLCLIVAHSDDDEADDEDTPLPPPRWADLIAAAQGTATCTFARALSKAGSSSSKSKKASAAAKATANASRGVRVASSGEDEWARLDLDPQTLRSRKWCAALHCALTAQPLKDVWILDDALDWVDAAALLQELHALQALASIECAHFVSTDFFSSAMRPSWFEQFHDALPKDSLAAAAHTLPQWRAFTPICFFSAQLLQQVRKALTDASVHPFHEILFATVCARNGWRMLDFTPRRVFRAVFEPPFSAEGVRAALAAESTVTALVPVCESGAVACAEQRSKRSS
jgi:GR25 family glycosyltransferase involved in LPS biosynthesis